MTIESLEGSGEGGTPNSAGTARPRSKAPPGTCDAHIHVLDPRFPTTGAPPLSGMTLDDYRALQRRLGSTRAVIVQAKPYGTDNNCLLDALARLGPEGRGVAVVHPSVGDAELRRLDEGGVRGLRFSVWNAADTITTIDMIEPLARRAADLGWHVQLHMSADQIAESATTLGRLPCPLVIDHMGRLPDADGLRHPAFRVITRLLDRGVAWVKLAGAYLDSAAGAPGYDDATRVASGFVDVAPERLVWGSDWPHVTEAHKPDDAGLFDLLGVWAGSERNRDRILVENPARLYGFDRPAG